MTSPFDQIRHLDGDQPYWLGRELMIELGYLKWQRFKDAIARAILSCENAKKAKPEDHFIHLPGSVSGSGNFGDDYKLSRHACNLIAMAGDPRKRQIAAAQEYFSGRIHEAETREAELRSLPPDNVRSLPLRPIAVHAKKMGTFELPPMEDIRREWSDLLLQKPLKQATDMLDLLMKTSEGFPRRPLGISDEEIIKASEASLFLTLKLLKHIQSPSLCGSLQGSQMAEIISIYLKPTRDTYW